MLLDYGTQLSYEPIPLSIGLLRKPKLRDISKITFDRFATFEYFLKCTPKEYYTKALSDYGGAEMWESFSEDKRESMTMYSIIVSDVPLQKLFVDLFNFFFMENVVYHKGFFILFDKNAEQVDDKVPLNSIHGIISDKNFSQVLDVIQQVCCIHNKSDESAEDQKFKNNLARQLFERMQKALKKQEEEKGTNVDKDLSLPNIISSVASKHPNYNLINIWELTVFQLVDSFKRMQSNTTYDIGRVRVSVWGDEKKTFDQALWHKNYYDT